MTAMRRGTPPRYLVEPTGHGRYRVVNSAGDFFQTFGHRDRAEEHAAMLSARDRKVAQVRQRPCLSCGKTFLSQGIHNRRCPCCNSSSSALGREFVGA